MSGKIYDQNMLTTDKALDNITDWYEVNPDSFDIYGLVPENEGLLTRRIPRDIAEKVSAGVLGQSGYGAGGRIVFATNSSFVALKIEYGAIAIPTVCNHCFSCGFDLYKHNENGQDIYVGGYRPQSVSSDCTVECKMGSKSGGKMSCYTINMPHFSEVKKLHIGLKKGSELAKQQKYRNDKPVVFYGSSITHGAAAGRPGNTYENFISQKYNLDYINLGFSGNAKGETAMAEYIASLDMCAFVCDYDHNAPNAEHLQNTHYPFYEIVRKAHPNIPYIMISNPDFISNTVENSRRRAVILDSYNKAISAGDKNVYFIDGEKLFEGEFYESCTSDGVHPNDLGFYRMAGKIGPVIADCLKIKL